jgi:hypothetical protein
MYDQPLGVTAIGFVAGLLVTWGIGLAPPLIIRHLVLKKPMKTWSAIGICFLFWVLNFIFFSALGSQSKSHAALGLVSVVSYWILRQKMTAQEEEHLRVAVNDVSDDGATPLMEAAMLGRVQQMCDLMSSGADADAMDERGWTPLMYAASQNEVEAIELLIKHGANPMIRNAENQTAADIAQNKGFLDAVEALLSSNSIGHVRD